MTKSNNKHKHFERGVSFNFINFPIPRVDKFLRRINGSHINPPLHLINSTLFYEHFHYLKIFQTN